MQSTAVKQVNEMFFREKISLQCEVEQQNKIQALQEHNNMTQEMMCMEFNTSNATDSLQPNNN